MSLGGGGKLDSGCRNNSEVRILLFIAGEPQKLNRQKQTSLESWGFREVFKLKFADILEVLVKLYPD